VEYSFWILSSALSVKNCNLNLLHTFSRSTMIAPTSTWCSLDALPAGVSGLVFFSNKEALSRLSCVDFSYTSYSGFHCLFALLLQTPLWEVCPGTNPLQQASSSAFLAWTIDKPNWRHSTAILIMLSHCDRLAASNNLSVDLTTTACRYCADSRCESTIAILLWACRHYPLVSKTTSMA